MQRIRKWTPWLLALGLLGASRVEAATITVTSLLDNSTLDGQVTLREAVLAANSDTSVDGSTAGSGADVIRFAASLAGGVINLSMVGDGTFGPSALRISTPLTISGNPASGISIARDGAAGRLRIFFVDAAGSLTLKNLTLQNGLALGGNGGNALFDGGGGGAGMGGSIFNQGTLNMSGVTLRGNTAQGGNGGNDFFPNSSAGGGGGMGGDGQNALGGQLGGDGGAPNGGAHGVSGSHDGKPGGSGGGGGGAANIGGYGLGGAGGFGGGGGGGNAGPGGMGGFGGGGGGNQSNTTRRPGGFGGGDGAQWAGGGGAGLGGAIFNDAGSVTITNVTLSGNFALGGNGGLSTAGVPTGFANGGSGYGGAVFNYNGTLNVLNATFANNTVTGGTGNTPGGVAGGGIFNLGDAATATANLTNTIAADSIGGTDFEGLAINGGANATAGAANLLESQTGFAGGIASTADPNLGPLANNSGPTFTHALLAGSPAIDSGTNTGAPAIDQREYGRNGTTDIGAFEFNGILPDFGDAPDSYGSLLASDGARHIAAGPRLGAARDSESDAQAPLDGTGDDASATDDEDGVVFSSILWAGLSASVDVTASAPGLLNAWMDFNADGDFSDPGEQVFTDQALAAGVNALSFNLPLGATPGPTFSRFRLDSTGGLPPTGLAADGEIEDYAVSIQPPPADLSITKTDAPDPVLAGANITYTVTVTNAGPGDASSVQFDDTVPPNTTFQSITPPAGWTQTALPAVGGTGAITYTRATLTVADGAQVFTIVVQVNPSVASGTNISNTATAAATTADPNLANNTATALTAVISQADLQITKTDAPDPAVEGQNITYTVTITNAGPSDALNVQFDDTIPLSTTFQSIVAPAGWTQVSLPPVGGNGTITYTRATLRAADGPQVFVIVVKVNFGAASGSPTSNTATASTTSTDPNLADNTATADTAIGGLSFGLKLLRARYSVDFARRRRFADPVPDSFSFSGKVSLAGLAAAGVDLKNLAATPVSASLGGLSLGLALPLRATPRLVLWQTVGGLKPFLRVTLHPVSGAYSVRVRGVDLDGAVGFPNANGVNAVLPLSAALTVGPWSDSALLNTVYTEKKMDTVGRGNFRFGQAAFDLPSGIFFVERARLLQRKIGGVLMQRVLVTVCFLPPDGVASDPSGGVGAVLNLGSFSEDVGGAGAPANFSANPSGSLFIYRRPLSAGRTGVARMVIDLRRWKMTALTHWMPANVSSPFGIAPVLNPTTDPRGSVVFAVGMTLTATYNASVLTGRTGVKFLSGNLNALP